ncbi:hypothetical protein [Dactylosporangium sp. CA-139066]
MAITAVYSKHGGRRQAALHVMALLLRRERHARKVQAAKQDE